MKRTIVTALFALSFGLAASPASAQQVQVDTAGAYGDAGCGLGSMLFGAQPGLVQVLAATTNGFLGNQTFGITTGTSNCGTSGAIVQAKAFVEGNRDALAKDIARGQGETLASLSRLAGCQSDAAVARTLQQNYAVIFPSAAVSDQNVSQSVLGVLKQNRGLSCNKLDNEA